MATLLDQRLALNSEIGVANDAEADPWPVAARNAAITQGYRALWTARAWKPVVVSVAASSTQNLYPNITGIMRLGFAETIDADGNAADYPYATLREDGKGGYELLMPVMDAGITVNLHGWTAYKSDFTGDSDADDLPAEFSRVPLLKAKAILYRQQASVLARFGEQARISYKTVLNLSLADLVSLVTTAEQEFAAAVHDMAVERPRYGHSLKRRA